jgi:6-phosphogluconolactonase
MITVAAGMEPHSVGVDPGGGLLYVANVMSSDVYTYAISSGGGLVQIGLPIASGVSPRSLAVDPSGGFLYVGNSDGTANSVSGYSILSSSGVLTSLGAAFPAGANPHCVATSGIIQ